VTRHRQIGSLVGRWGFVALCVIAFIIATSLYATNAMTPDTYRLCVLALVCFELVIVTFAAISLSSSAIAREREDGSLDLLLTTSITPKTYLGGKVRGLTMHLLPMVLVPCLTMVTVGCIVLIDPSGAVVNDQLLIGSTTNSVVPLALTAPALLTPLVVFPYIAFCISLGLMWSMRSKGAISAMVSSLVLVVVVTGGLGMCLIPGSTMGHIGSFFAAMSPINAVRSTLMSVDVIPSVVSEGIATANISLAIATVIAGIGWSLISMGLLRSMSASFVVTVRRLAGIN
jgi:ABC-type Na+ efflux pump permease subunit